MQKITLFLCLLICLMSCKSSKIKTEETKKYRDSEKTSTTHIATDNIVKYAEKLEGVRYKYGGDSKKGMDCSGLITTAFNSENIKLPRTTYELAKTGNWVDLKQVRKGDLLFFATKKNSRKVNHVGLVTDVRTGHVEFIHSTTSKGVIKSKVSDRYWYFAFVQARRVL